MKHMKLKPSQTTVDHRYQRELDAKRVQKMAEDYRADLIGVPVVSRRSDGSYVRIDGQHRLAAAIAADRGEDAVMMEVFDGLSLQQEAELFLRLNGGRTPVNAIDKYKARLEAKEPIALEIQTILRKHHCRIVTSAPRGGVRAVAAVEWAYHRGNLDTTMYVLSAWLDNDSAAYEGQFVRAVSAFFSAYPDADANLLVRKLSRTSAARLLKQMNRESRETTPTEGGVYVMLGIYNYNTPQRQRLAGMAQQAASQPGALKVA